MPSRECKVEWFICRMDWDDVKYAKSQGNKTAKVGDEMWRVPVSIGPISIDHSHWAGTHIDCTPKQAERIAHLISNDPEFPWDD